MSKFCENCGAQLEDDANFCTSCGNKSESAVSPTEAPASEPVPETAPEATVETTTEPVTETKPEPAAEPSTEQPADDAAEQTETDEKNPYNTPHSTDSAPFVAYTPSGTAATEPTAADSTYPEYEAAAQPKKSGKGSLIAIITILIVILALVIGAGVLIYFMCFSGGDYEEAIEAYYDAEEDFKYEDFRKAAGDTALIYFVEEENESDITTFETGCQRMQKIYKQTTGDVDIDYEILDAQKMSDDDLKEYDEGSLVAEKGYEVDISYTVMDESTGDKEDYSETLTIVKFDGDWCVTDIVEAFESIIEIGELSNDDFDMVLEYYNDN